MGVRDVDENNLSHHFLKEVAVCLAADGKPKG